MFRIFSSPARIRSALLVSAALLTSACSDSTAPKKSANGGGANGNGGTGTGASGTYTLRAIDRNSLPYDIHRGPFFDATNKHFYNQLIVRVTSGAIVLDPLGDVNVWLDYAITADGQSSNKHVENAGTWKMVGNQVTIYVDGKATAQFTIQNGQVVESADVIPDGTMHEYTFQK